MPAVQPHPELITIEQYEALPEDRRAEIFDNAIYTLSHEVRPPERSCVTGCPVGYDYYQKYGVREYWIVDPQRKNVIVNYFEGNALNVPYMFDSVIKVNIYDDLYINFSDIARVVYL